MADIFSKEVQTPVATGRKCLRAITPPLPQQFQKLQLFAQLVLVCKLLILFIVSAKDTAMAWSGRYALRAKECEYDIALPPRTLNDLND